MWAGRLIQARDRRCARSTEEPTNTPNGKKNMANNDNKPAEKCEMTEMRRITPAEMDQPDKNLLEREEPRYSRSKPGMDMNLYATKKSVAQGMMDIALLTANASQLKYILKEGEESRFYLVNVICIGVSISLQMVVGVLLILNTRYNINLTCQQSRAELMNNLTIIGIFLITVANVFVSAFGTSQ